MRQVPHDAGSPAHHLLIGNGRLSRHLTHYFKLEGLPSTAWARPRELTEAFFDLLRGLPGFQPHPRMEDGIPADALGPMARLRVDDEIGIEFVHVPSDARFASLWPLAGHGALGTFLLLGGTDSDATAALAPLAETLGSLPRARLLHLLMKRGGEPDFADELRRNVSLLEESQLFLLPLEGRKEPLDRLRGAFSRIVP